MNKSNGIEFRTDMPDDCVWDVDGEVVVRPGGMALSKALVSLFEEDGMRASEPEPDEEHDRWDFKLDWGGARFRVEVVHMDFCMIVVYGGPWLPSRLIFPNVPRREDLTEHIGAILAGDPRFSHIKFIRAY